MKNKINNIQKNFYFQNFTNDDKININSSNSLFNSRANFVFRNIFFSFLDYFIKAFVSWL